MQAHWSEILNLLDALPRSEEVSAVLKSLESSCTPAEEVRPRYTILQMLWDLELLKPLVETIL